MKEKRDDIRIEWSFVSTPETAVSVQPKAPVEVSGQVFVSSPWACVSADLGSGGSDQHPPGQTSPLVAEKGRPRQGGRDGSGGSGAGLYPSAPVVTWQL